MSIHTIDGSEGKLAGVLVLVAYLGLRRRYMRIAIAHDTQPAHLNPPHNSDQNNRPEGYRQYRGCHDMIHWQVIED